MINPKTIEGATRHALEQGRVPTFSPLSDAVKLIPVSPDVTTPVYPRQGDHLAIGGLDEPDFRGMDDFVL